MISISIKSEIDSRVVLYPLLRCLSPLGSCLLVTSNKQVSRIIDGDFEGYFRNFHILVDLDGGTDELLEGINIDPNDYNYVVYDNVGVIEQDKLLIPIGPIISDTFESEMLYLGEDKNTHIIRFGKSINKKTPVKLSNEDKKLLKEEAKEEAKRRSLLSKEELKAEKEEQDKNKADGKTKPKLTQEEMENAAKLKFKPKKVDVMTKLKKLPNLQFPKFDELELLESNKQFFTIDKNFVKFFYTMFEEYIGIKEPNFVKEVTRKDESSSDFNQRAASGENSIEFTSK